MTKGLNVLGVGSSQMLDRLRDALLPDHRYSLSVASDYWGLCSLSLNQAQAVSIAVLEPATSNGDLRRSAEHVRRRWPDARIILLGQYENLLEDQLYDERVLPRFHPPELLGVMERLLKAKGI